MLFSAPRFFSSAALALGALLCGAARAAESVAALPRLIPDLAYLAPDRAEKLDLYLPVAPASGKRSPAVVWIHGGGWTGGVKTENRAKEICTTLAAAGYVAVSVDYKLGDGAWPTNLHDCKNAVRFLRAHAVKYQLDPDRIAVAGGSAGGHLALMVGFTGDQPEFEPAGAATPYPGVSSQVRAVIDLYGPVNLLTRQEVDEKGTPLRWLRTNADGRALFLEVSISTPVRISVPYFGYNVVAEDPRQVLNIAVNAGLELPDALP